MGRWTLRPPGQIGQIERNTLPQTSFAHNAQIAQPPAVPETAWTEDHNERAAIAEFDGGAPRAWAEGFARLDPDHPPAYVPLTRWRQFIGDAGRFLDEKWPARAAALGWEPLDLFGCDRHRPFARIDRAGLLWLLNGGRLLDLSGDQAVIERPGGVRQTFRRVLSPAGKVLAWDLRVSGDKPHQPPA
jgi:hypothetical protein